MLPEDPRHGTNAGYLAGCRERCCKDAAARKENLRRLDRLRGIERTVPVVGSVRRVHALQALGWPTRLLSLHLGMSQDWLHATIRTKSGRIYRHNHERIVALYDEFSMKVGPSEITKQRARKAGWLPPLALDDDRIDDPDYRPNTGTLRKASKDFDEAVILRVLGGEILPTSLPEKREIMRRWLASGGSEAELCRRMGWKTGRYVGAKAQPDRTERKAS